MDKINKTKNQKSKIKNVSSTSKQTTEAVEAEFTVKEPKSKTGLAFEVMGKDGKSAGKITLPGEIFAAKINPVLMAQAVRVYMANQRAGSGSTKTRGEVQGSTRKIYRQKGTGRARHGGIRAPIFVGGGIALGPKPRDFSLKLPEKMRRKALFSSLTQKIQDKKVTILSQIEGLKGKTSEMQKIFQSLNLTNKKGKTLNVLLVITRTDNLVKQASKNIEGVTIFYPQDLNVYEVLKSHYVVFLKDTISDLEKTFLKK